MRNVLSVTSLTLALALVLTVPGAQAASLNIYTNCALLPWGTFGPAGITTAVGLTSRVDGIVEWAFFDEDGDRLDDGRFAIEADELTGLTLDLVLSPALSGATGFMLFCLDSNADGLITVDDNGVLVANAFYVDLPNNDVAFLPVWSVTAGNLDEPDPENWTEEPIVDIPLLAAGTGASVDMQYLVDGVVGDGDNTRIVIFTSDEPSLLVSMQAIGPGRQLEVSVELPHGRLNVLDVESIEEISALQGLRPSGFLRWNIPANAGSVVAFSLVESPGFGALQTLLGNVLP